MGSLLINQKASYKAICGLQQTWRSFAHELFAVVCTQKKKQRAGKKTDLLIRLLTHSALRM